MHEYANIWFRFDDTHEQEKKKQDEKERRDRILRESQTVVSEREIELDQIM